MISKNSYLITVKVALSIIQGVATYEVFMCTNQNLPLLVRILLALCAIVTVDGMILFCFSMLENMSIPASEKRPWVALNVLLTGAVFAIGYLEQHSFLAFAPRLGLAALAVADVFLWSDQWQRERNTREKQEQRIRDRMVIARRKAKEKAERAALKLLEPELEKRAVATMRRDLGFDSPAPLIDKREPEVVDDDIIRQISARRWGWVHPVTGELVTKGATGNPYTSERGARIAYARQLKQVQLPLFSGDSPD